MEGLEMDNQIKSEIMTQCYLISEVTSVFSNMYWNNKPKKGGKGSTYYKDMLKTF